MNGFRFPIVGVLLGSALIAGFITYVVTLRQRSQPKTVVDRAMEIGNAEAARAGREFISEKVVPEMKPVLMHLIKEAEAYVDRYFDQAQKSVKAL